MPNWALAIILAVLSAGFGVSVLSIFRGVDTFRGRTAKTEARGIALLERSWLQDEWSKRVAIHRMEYYRDEQNPYLRNRIGDLEYVIRTRLGPNEVPPWAPGPELRPLPDMSPRLIELIRKADHDHSDTPADAGGRE
jgi:hypothetical protein